MSWICPKCRGTLRSIVIAGGLFASHVVGEAHEGMVADLDEHRSPIKHAPEGMEFDPIGIPGIYTIAEVIATTTTTTTTTADPSAADKSSDPPLNLPEPCIPSEGKIVAWTKYGWHEIDDCGFAG